jgi:NADH-quinone oxidoreductase subunit A
MQGSQDISEFGKIFIFMLLGIAFILIGMAINAFLQKSKPNPLKNSTYECGEITSGPSRTPFNMRFYMIAIVFLLFDVELIFLFPWSTIFANKELIETIPQWGLFNMVEMSIFIFILLLGLVYVWRKGDLEWIRPQINLTKANTSIPSNFYEAINTINYTVKSFKVKEKEVVAEVAPAATNAAPAGIRRPPFRSAVKKESNE